MQDHIVKPSPDESPLPDAREPLSALAGPRPKPRPLTMALLLIILLLLLPSFLLSVFWHVLQRWLHIGNS